MVIPELAPAVHDSVVLARFLLSAAADVGADSHRLVQDSELPGWALAADHGMIPSRHALRVWELAEHALDVPHVTLSIAGRYQTGGLGLYDYLFTTAATLREGLQASQDFLYLVTTNGRLQIDAETEREITYSYRHIDTDSRGAQLAQQFATGRLIVPANVAFASPAPRSHHALTETFGTRRIDFDAPVTTFTLHASDLDLPLRGADPVLASLLSRFTASLPPPPPATWHEQFQQRLAEAIEQGNPSLDALARHMLISTRTLQRLLAQHGTTWLAERDTARQRRAQQARKTGTPDMTRLAHHLGYSDARSARRALRRWDARTGQPAGDPSRPR